MTSVYDFTIPGMITNLVSNYDISLSGAWLILVLFQFLPFYILFSQYFWIWVTKDYRDRDNYKDKTWLGIIFNWPNTDNPDFSKEPSTDTLQSFYVTLIAAWVILQILVSLIALVVYFIIQLPIIFSVLFLSIITIGTILPLIVFISRINVRKEQRLLEKLGQEKAPN